jgi:tetratricopeptide (TPR) repeat protein
LKQIGLKTTISIFILTVLFSTISCSRKSKGWTNRTYHNTTAHYNAFFNGRESFKEGEVLLKSTIKENYLKVLPIFPLPTKENAISSSPQMDRAIEKGAKVIKKHSMFIKGIEYCNWVDDSYMMIGKAFYNKQEYDQAKRTFNYLINNYKKSDLVDEAMIWLARSSQQLNETSKIETIYENLRIKIRRNPNPKTQLLFNMAYADYLISNQQYETAIQYVQEAIKLKPKKAEKRRLYFILGQLYQTSEKLNQAFDQYAQVLKLNPPYELGFNARINMARCFEGGSNSAKKILVLKELKKMLKDDKNKEYFDQIYYTLAEISLKDEKEEEAVDYLVLSVQTSIINDYQKSASALKLGDLYFAKLQYVNAQQYYDTAMTVLPKTFPNYEAIKKKTLVLGDLVSNLIVVQTQDSLQRLGKMSDSERNRIIDKIISDYNEKEIKRQREEAERAQTLQTLTQNNNPNNNNSQGGWYFYNSSTLQFGAAEFKKKWGNRKLEDNWRLSNKELIFESTATVDSVEVDPDDTTTATTKGPTSSDPRNRATYLKDIPTTADQIKKSNDKIAVALYNMGFIYQEGLNDTPKSNESVEQLYQRFPEYKKMVSALYLAYNNYTSLNNAEKAAYYKQLIISKYPNTDYAEILKDPNYYKKIKERQNEGEIFYSETYSDFQSKQYAAVITKTASATQRFPKNKTLLARFEYIAAISAGKLYNNNDSLKTRLTNLITKYPDAPAKEMAQLMLNGLNNPGGSNSTTSSSVVESVPTLQFNEKDFHFYIMIADIRDVNFTELKNKYSDLNKSFFSTLSLQTSAIYIDDKNQLITIGKFENKTRAMDYYNFVKANQTVFKGINLTKVTQYVISDKNYPVFYKNKSIRDEYQKFFETNYLNKR